MRQFASWNPARDVWEETTTGLFCEHSDVFLETWPTSGMTRAGAAYGLPTWAHRTGGSGSSSLPIPRATRGGSATETTALLASPRTSDTNGPGVHGDGGMDLRTQVSLLPTPMTRDWKGGQMPENEEQLTTARGDGGRSDLCSAAMWIGASTPPPSTDGNTSSDAVLLPLLSQGPKADNA